MIVIGVGRLVPGVAAWWRYMIISGRVARMTGNVAGTFARS
jgi:hypothetical protein